MTDIYVALAIITCVSALLFCAALWLAGRLRRRARLALTIAALALLVLAAIYGRDHVGLAKVLPFTSLIVLGNLEIPAAAFFAGLSWRSIDPPTGRRAMVLAPLLVVCAYRMFVPLAGRPPDCRGQWNRGVCLQTSDATCSAAAAATLLAHYQIKATEQEMADLCLTRPAGTYMHGLYRGLKRKTADAPLRVQTFTGDVDGLRERTKDGPVVISVGLSRWSDADPVYAQRYGWTPGVKHTVVLYGFLPGDRVEIGDPSVGRERWSVKDLQTLYRGEGMKLVAR